MIKGEISWLFMLFASQKMQNSSHIERKGENLDFYGLQSKPIGHSKVLTCKADNFYIGQSEEF